jgi:high-affinity Fe2+/Pb2+ permease
MKMTVGMWVLFGVAIVIGLVIAAAVWASDSPTGAIITILITAIVAGGICWGGHWYYGSTADGIRAMKDQQSNFDNGLNREIIITAEDGREIFYYKGKCDIEHNNGYILFETENGKRMMIYYGITDTIIISEY